MRPSLCSSPARRMACGPTSRWRTPATNGSACAAWCCAETELDDLAVRFGAILPPTSTTTIPLSIALPQTTPPGEYDAQIEIGGQSRQVRLQVDPKISARLTPDQILAPPGTSQVGLRIANQGNVDIPLAAVTRARTTDDGPDFGADVTLDLGRSRGPAHRGRRSS